MQLILPIHAADHARQKPGVWSRQLDAAPEEDVGELPDGYVIEEDKRGLHLVRLSDSHDFGPMASVRIAIRHAHAMQRISTQ